MQESVSLEGGCLCGRVRYQLFAKPFATECCHCNMCQKASGAPLTTWMDVKISQCQWTKEKPTEYESSEFVRRGFCPQCGSSLSFRDIRHPEYFTLTINSLDEPNLVEPERHIYTQDQVGWLNIHDDIPRFAKGPVKPEQ